MNHCNGDHRSQYMFNLNPASDWAPHFDPDPHEQTDEFSRIAKEAEYVDRHGFVPDQKKGIEQTTYPGI